MQSASDSIQILPVDVVNQIAAGEVVERPAHLVKELIENSLDAGATSIEIQLFANSLDLVILDNGKGMSKDDLVMSVKPHSTSKIAQFSDLQSLNSYGFRGEALASITSVSESSITSKKMGSDSAHRLDLQFGEVKSISPANFNEGTEIKIQNLFQNVPARLKFLKSVSAEQSQIINVVKSFALVRPEVGFKILKNQSLVSYWPATGDWISRVEGVLEASPFVECSLEESNLRLRIAFLPPSQVFKTSKNIWLFAQKRWIQDKSLQFAVMESYRSTLMTKEFPAVVVDLDCDPGLIDVNVHPTKSQVRFHQDLHVLRSIQKCLQQGIISQPTHTSVEKREPIPLENLVRRVSDPIPESETIVKPILPPSMEHNLSLSDSEFEVTNYQKRPRIDLSSEREGLFVPSVKTATPAISQSNWASFDVVGQVHLTYLVCQSEGSMVLIDQHAAHERILYDKYLRGWKSGEIDVQSFLLPISVDLSEEQIELLLAKSSELSKLGFEVDQGGPKTILVRAAPAGISEASIEKALIQMAHELLDVGEANSFEDLIAHICATMACHSAIRAGQALNHEQIKNLLMQMDQVELADYCPHGRPVSIDFDRTWLEKKFGRIE